MKKVTVTQSPEKSVPTEILADAIIEISRGMKNLRAGRLTDRALVILIQNSCGAAVSRNVISLVIEAIENLESQYVKPQGKTK